MNKTDIWHKWDTFDGCFYCFSPLEGCHYYSISRNFNYEQTIDFLNKENLSGVIKIKDDPVAYKYLTSYEPDRPESYEGGVDLPSGVYEYQGSSTPPYNRIVPIDVRNDTFIQSDSSYNEISKEFRSFLDNEKLYRDLSIIYKRSVLMYGPPGEGKTAIIREIIRKEVPKDAVVIFFNTLPPVSYIIKLSKTLSNRLKVFVFEELVLILDSESLLQNFLEFMDGEKSIDHSFIFGTTNHPEKLSPNITNRPSRWDRLIKINGLDNESKKELVYFYLKREISNEEFELIKEFSTASIKEACLAIRLHGLSFKESVDKIVNHNRIVKNEFKEKGKLGLE